MSFWKKLFKVKYKYVYPKKYFNFKVIEDYEIRPLYDLKDNLIYMHAYVLYEDDNYIVFFKESNNVMYKYVIIYNYDSYRKQHLSDELIVAANLGRQFDYGLKLEHIGKINTVEVYIFAQLNEDTIKYSIAYPKQEKDKYQMGLVYDNENHRLLQFQYTRTSGALYGEFKSAIYKDINAKDKEDY